MKCWNIYLSILIIKIKNINSLNIKYWALSHLRNDKNLKKHALKILKIYKNMKINKLFISMNSNQGSLINNQ